MASRNPASDAARALAARDVEVVHADLLDPGSLGVAFEGAHGAFVVTDFWEPTQGAREEEIGAAAVRAAREARVEHLIWSTLPDVEKLTGGRRKVPMAPQPLPGGGRGWAVPMDPSKRVIAAGGRHTCVALTSGGARCWGQGDMGQLGNGSNVHSSTPVLVSGISGATAASAGSEFSCLSSNGALKCWGRNHNGQLGNGATANSSTPVTTTAVAAGNYDPTTLMGGHQETCMKLADTTAFCFP